MSDLGSHALLLEQVVHDLGLELARSDDGPDLFARARQIIEGAHSALAEVRAALDDRLGDAMDAHTIVVDGLGQVTRHKRKSRTKWDKDDLLRAVLDSRIADKSTGEVKDETPLDRVMHVWNLPAPRVTALRERGIDADEYCHTETREGWTIQVAQDATDMVAPLIERARGNSLAPAAARAGDGATCPPSDAPSPASSRETGDAA